MRSELLLAAVVLASCGGGGDTVDIPTFPDGGLLRDATPVPSLVALSGLHRVESGAELLGGEVFVRASSSSVSVFAEPEATYLVTKGGCLADGRLVLEGHLRHATTTQTGLVRLFVGPETNARALCRGELPTEPLVLDGTAQSSTIRLRRTRAPRDPGGRFYVVAHRGGCRTLDRCGASENSVEVIRLAESLGADAVEVDVRLTSDGVPILYHDDAFDARLTKGAYCHGDVADFPLVHVRALCRLEGGEQVPTLEDALAAAIDDTSLRGVWLDVKSVEALGPTRVVAERQAARARALGRDLQIVAGLWSSELVDAWAASPPPAAVTCLSELEPGDLERAGCTVWGPRWTRGLMESDVRAVQARGHRVAYWTLDEREFIDAFLGARPDAILTNRPGLVRLRFEQMGATP